MGCIKPKRWVSEGFDGIGISHSSSDRIPDYSIIDTSISVIPVGSDEEILKLPIPWIIRSPRGLTYPDGQIRIPSIVGAGPNEGDLLIVGEKELAEFPDNARGISGIVLDLQSLPPMNDAEIEAIVVSLSSHLSSSSLILLRERADSVEGLFTYVVDHE